MDDLIKRRDAERALTILGAQLSEKHTRTVAKCVCAIKDVPAVDVNDPCRDCRMQCEEPCWKVEHGLLIEARHGQWLVDGACSMCGEYDARDPYGSKYCPNCGKKMDEKEEEK